MRAAGGALGKWVEKREGSIRGFEEDGSFALGSKDVGATPPGTSRLGPGLMLSPVSQIQRDSACETHSSKPPGGRWWCRRGEGGNVVRDGASVGRMESSGEGGGDGRT